MLIRAGPVSLAMRAVLKVPLKTLKFVFSSSYTFQVEREKREEVFQKFELANLPTPDPAESPVNKTTPEVPTQTWEVTTLEKVEKVLQVRPRPDLHPLLSHGHRTFNFWDHIELFAGEAGPQPHHRVRERRSRPRKGPRRDQPSQGSAA